MPWPSRLDLRRAEVHLREYDRALRLRLSQEAHSTILVERKTFRGRIGTIFIGGIPWSPDTGRRKEEGHVDVARIQSACFDPQVLLDSLKHADTWQRWNTNAVPLWRQVEEREERERARKVRSRQDGLRYKSSELFDRYVWKYRQRVSVPEKIA